MFDIVGLLIKKFAGEKLESIGIAHKLFAIWLFWYEELLIRDLICNSFHLNHRLFISKGSNGKKLEKVTILSFFVSAALLNMGILLHKEATDINHFGAECTTGKTWP